jgi:N-methylhydantoinase A
MEKAWVAKVAATLKAFTAITKDTTLAAFGGGGPFVVCRIAEASGIDRVIIPGLAAVFSAFGIGFSDIAHHYEAPLASNDAAGLKAARSGLLERARRGMFAEGFGLESCQLKWSAQVGERTVEFTGDKLPKDLSGKAKASITLEALKPISHASLSGRFGGKTQAATSSGKRNGAPLYRVEDQKAGASARGPAVLEESFFTCRLDPGWKFEINPAGDILLSKV